MGFFLSTFFGFFFGFALGVGCALAVLYTIYTGGYRKGLEDSLRLEKPPRYLKLMPRAAARVAREERFTARPKDGAGRPGEQLETAETSPIARGEWAMADTQDKPAVEAGSGKEKNSGSSGREFGNQHSTQAENASENKGLAGENATASDEIVHEQPE